VSAPPVSGVPASAPPYSHLRPVSAPPVRGGPESVLPASAPPVSAPPSWPPVVADRDATGATPAVPESLAAALDMTAEIPRLRPDRAAEDDSARSSASRVESSDTGQQAGAGTTGQEADAVRQASPVSGQPETSRPVDHAAAAHEVATAQAAAAQATATAQSAAAQVAARQRASSAGQGRFADETMELPIFRELESAWFTTGHPGETPDGTSPQTAEEAALPVADGAAADAVAGTPISAQRFSTAEPARSPGVPQQASSPEGGADRIAEFVANGDARKSAVITAPSAATNGNGGPGAGGWRTAADDGWQAARAAAELPVDTTTTAGLPRRTPMAQLVPGGVERPGASVQRRTPEAVRGLLSAYHRGVQRGRTKDHPSNPEETPGGQQSSQAGKEHEG
jgi:hypothetical protein